MRWLGLLTAIAGIALADGGMVVPPGEEIQEYGQVAIVRHFDGVEELAIVAELQTTSGFAWIVPLPAQPEVDSFDLELLYALQEYCQPVYRGGTGCACGYVEPGNGDLGEGGRGVEEIGGGVIGIWEWKLFRATEPDTLTSYLDSLGFELPSGITAAFDHYIDKDWNWFVVARVVDSISMYYRNHVGIRFSFESDAIVYPLYISRVSSEGAPVTLYVLSAHRQMYDGARLRFSGRVDTQTFPAHPGFVEDESHLTKLYRYFPEDEMEDIHLRQAPDDEEYRAIEYYGARDGMTGMFAMLCIVLVLRGRKKRRRA